MKNLKKPASVPCFLIDETTTFGEAALLWFKFGLQVIPVIPGTKIPAVKWNAWFHGLDEEKIKDYWNKHRDHELAFMVGKGIVVFDMDSKEASTAMLQLMRKHDMYPTMLVKTEHGTHYYFRLEVGVNIMMDSHSTSEHPERIDVKTGRSAVMLPPSTAKVVALLKANNVSELASASQEFIDAVFRHNGRPAPSAAKPSPKMDAVKVTTLPSLSKLKILLDQIDPDSGYQDWLKAIMAVYHETNGSDEGLDLVDAWSSKGDKYESLSDVETTWRSLHSEHENPVTIATLFSLAFDNVEPFQRCETVVISSIAQSSKPVEEAAKGQGGSDRELNSSSNPLDAYGINNHFAGVKTIPEAIAALGNFVMRGEVTVIFADSNCGKTILILFLVRKAIQDGAIAPSHVGYINKDDSGHGLLEKVKFADELGVRVISDVKGQSFNRQNFLNMLGEIIESGHAAESVIIVDTLKKFVNVNDKEDAVKFYNSVRPFTLAGGTLVFLAHNNKYRNSEGKGVYSGTSDNLQDVDAAYSMDIVSDSTLINPERIVNLEAAKSRLSSAKVSMYGYNAADELTWLERINTVREISPDELTKIQFSHARKNDEEIITSLTATLREGGKAPKMKLVKSVSDDTGFSRNAVLAVLSRYTGNNLDRHDWNFQVGERGAKYYRLLDKDIAAD